MLKKWSLGLVFVLSIAACAPSAVSIRPEDKAGIKTIAILQIEEPQLRMLNLGSGMAAMGAVGGAAIAAGDESQKLFNELKKNKFSFRDQLTRDLKNQLKKVGYKTIVVKVKRADVRSLLGDYSKLRIKNADAILDVVVTNYGYVTEHFLFSPHWRPEARAFVAMAKPMGTQVIYQDTMMYGYHNPLMSGVELDASPAFHFAEQDDVFKAGSKKIISGLKDASLKIAMQISSSLSK
ncbi:MAG: hypothetical protein OEY43_05485 [Gammaproteobacteria bacterium]|nr:hypothetical protein [Gammaproteobacteria bacterium]